MSSSFPLVLNLGTDVSGSSGSAAAVLSIDLVNLNVSTRWFMLFDSKTAPTTGDEPRVVLAVPGSSGRDVGGEFFGSGGMYFTSGVAWGWSTAAATYQPATASDHTTQILGGG